MTSLISATKQIPLNSGYYVCVGDARTRFYFNAGTTDAPNISSVAFGNPSQGSVSTGLIAGGMLRDHGVTLLSAGRVFRKVQVMMGTSSVTVGGTDGVAGMFNASNTTPSYGTGFIELPGTGGYSSGSGNFTPVARLG